MNEIKIEWVKTNYNTILLNPDTYFYAFSRGSNLLYIGITYRQDIKDEINQTLKRLNINLKGVSIWLGYINSNQTSYQRITKKIILHTECLMIKTNNTSYNQQCAINYTGRTNFKVKTSGCSLIRKCVRHENNRVYLSC